MATISENIKSNILFLFFSIFVTFVGFYELLKSLNIPEEMNITFKVVGILGILGSLFISSP